MASTSMHNDVHNWIGGDMRTGASPNDPVFFLHHANIDRMWHAWQEKYPLSPYVPLDMEPDALLFHRYSDRMFTYFDETVAPKDVLDISSRYQYDTLADLY
ncbi:MAG: tyrosinase family protein [Planctomycetota bacterium]